MMSNKLQEIDWSQPTDEELQDYIKDWDLERLYQSIDKLDKRIKELSKDIDMWKRRKCLLVQIYDKKEGEKLRRKQGMWRSLAERTRFKLWAQCKRRFKSYHPYWVRIMKEKSMYYCREQDAWHYLEFYGWFDSDREACFEFKKFLNKKKVLYKKTKWCLGRVLPQDNISRDLVVTEIKTFRIRQRKITKG